ncbi:MAG: DUF721 domain-containing protein [Parvibaculaceae bacterium]
MERLDRQFRTLTKACFARHGQGYADLLGAWAMIVGDDLAAIARPERLRWPQRQAEEGRGGAVLILRVAEGRALEVQHEVSRILERINGFFGYEAVRGLKILQGPLGGESRGRTALPEPSPAAREKVEARLLEVEDARLKDALRRLGHAVSVSNTRR